MKSMLYVGATLMIGASIYGFADYKQTSQKKEFTNMYDHKTVKLPVVVEEKTEPVVEKKENPAVVKKINTVAKKKVVAKIEVTGDPLPVIDPISDDEVITERETETIDKMPVEVKTSKEPTVKKTKKKKLNHKIFSRAPLREDDVVAEPIKENKKTVRNEL